MNDNELYHHGVKGMRWGVRNSKNPTVNSGAMNKLKKHTKMVEKLKKNGELNKAPKMDTDDEKYTVMSPKEVINRSKPSKAPKNAPKKDSTNKPAKDTSIKKKTKDNSTKKPSKEDKNKNDKNKNDDNQTDTNKTNEKRKPNAKEIGETRELVDKITKKGTTVFTETSNLVSRSANKERAIPSEKVKKELSEMDDRQLQQKINRIKMEREYTSLNPSEKALAKERTASVLSSIGSLVAIGGSIASVALAFRQLRARDN